MNSEMPRGDDRFYFSRVTDVSGQESAHHYHESLEIYCLISGNCNYFIESTSYKVSPGDIVVIPGGTIHRTNYSSRTHSRLLINCPESLLTESLSKMLSSIRGIYRNEDMLSELISLFEKIEAEYTHPDDLSQGLIISYTVELLSLIARGENAKSDASVGYAERMIKYVQENYMNDIRLSELAAEMGKSTEHLCRIFKSETGFCFSEYLNIYRLRKAEYMLKNEPGKSVSEIAFASGFNDSNYFSYKFKKAYGVPPMKMKTLNK